MKSKYVALFVLILFLLSGCAKAEMEVPAVELTPTSEPAKEAIREGLVLVDEEFDYSSDEGFAQNWSLNLDRNYCPNIPVDLANVSRHIVDVNGNNMAMVSVNEDGIPGLFINAILSKRLERCDRCTIVGGAYVGLPPRETLTEQELEAGEPEKEEQLVNISIEVCDGGTCWYGEVLYYLNKWVTKENYEDFGLGYYAGQTYLRYVDHVTRVEKVKILDGALGDDRKFHYLEVTVSVDVASGHYYIEQARVDDQVFDDLHWAMWPEVKAPGYEDVMQIFLETHNMWTNCDTQHNFYTVSYWDKVKVVQYPFGESPNLLTSNN